MLFLDLVSSSFADNICTRVLWLFPTRIKICVKGLAVSRPSWDLETGVIKTYLRKVSIGD